MGLEYLCHLLIIVFTDFCKKYVLSALRIFKRIRQYPPYKVKLYSYSSVYKPAKKILTIKKEAILTAKTNLDHFIEYPPIEDRSRHSVMISIGAARISEARRHFGYYSQFDTYNTKCYRVKTMIDKGKSRKITVEYIYSNVRYDTLNGFIEDEPVVEYMIPVFAVCRPSRIRFGLSVQGKRAIRSAPWVGCIHEDHTTIQIAKMIYMPEEKQYVGEIRKAYPTRRYVVHFSLTTHNNNLKPEDRPASSGKRKK